MIDLLKRKKCTYRHFFLFFFVQMFYIKVKAFIVYCNSNALFLE